MRDVLHHMGTFVVIVRLLCSTEHTVLERVAPDVFDDAPVPKLTTEFLANARH
jgi:hypothetical protein